MLTPILLFGQNEQITKIDLAKNNIYAEAHLGLFTKVVMNYEWQIYSGEKVSWYGRLGGGWGFNGIDGLFDSYYGPGGLGAITMLIGRNNNHFELNTGAFIGNEQILRKGYGDTFLFPIINIGYRYQNPYGHIFRANVGYLSAGLSFGYAF